MPAQDQQDQQDQQLPEDELMYAPTFEQQQALTQKGQAEYLKTLQEQEKIAQEAPEAIRKKGEAALAGEREKSGRVFAAGLAQGGGGSLAGMRQSQLSRGIAEGQLMGDYTMQQIAAQKLAAAAKGEYLTEKQKLQQQAYEAPMEKQKEVESAKNDILNEFNSRVKNQTWWGEEDRQSMMQWVAYKYLTPEMKKRNPAVWEMARDAWEKIRAESAEFNA